jgi:hypothetical protein
MCLGKPAGSVTIAFSPLKVIDGFSLSLDAAAHQFGDSVAFLPRVRGFVVGFAEINF